jgi:hypothetical protein
MMAMLIRAGLPSRRAAMTAIRTGSASFITAAEMREWLSSNEITAFSDQGDWPTSEMAALWRRFREEVLSGRVQAWSIASWKRLLDVPDSAALPSPGLYRIETDPDDPNTTWLSTPDYRRIVRFKKSVRDLKPSLFAARLAGGVADISRIGRGKANCPPATSL